MKADKLKKLILSLTQDIEFTFNGRDGCIIPINKNDLSMCYDGKSKEYDNIDKLMSDNFFDGKSLNDISEALEIG